MVRAIGRNMKRLAKFLMVQELVNFAAVGVLVWILLEKADYNLLGFLAFLIVCTAGSVIAWSLQILLRFWGGIVEKAADIDVDADVLLQERECTQREEKD